MSNKLTVTMLRIISLFILIFWSVTLIGLLYWSVSKEKQYTLDYAQMEAKANFNKDIALRNWASKRGGVYVPISKDTPANPYLKHVAERDISTPTGVELTLMNPAYMLRQTMNEFSELYGIKGRIVGLTPLNPINIPDPWEVSVLNKFKSGTKEVSELSNINGKLYLRYMQVFNTQEKCLKCHEQQGYKIGDVQGGVGVSIPLEPYLRLEQDSINILMYSYAVIWLIGFFGILWVNIFVEKQIIRENEMKYNLFRKKQSLELVLEGTRLGTWDWDLRTNTVIFNEIWADILGYKLANIECTLDTWKSKVHPDDLDACYKDISAHIDGKTYFYNNIHRMMHKDGNWRYILDRGKIIERDKDDKPIRFMGTHTDITKIKETENALLIKTKKLEEQSSELERLNKILSQQAMYDGLTHVCNRRAFDQRIKQEWAAWHQNQSNFSILIADIDFFKKYNDSYGHLRGDSCLKTVAQTLNNTVIRRDDFVARYGGEEFVIILPHTDVEQASLVAEKIRNAIENLAIPHDASDCAAVVTVSIGVASCQQLRQRYNYHPLISLADKALYLAKAKGRNAVVVSQEPRSY